MTANDETSVCGGPGAIQDEGAERTSPGISSSLNDCSSNFKCENGDIDHSKPKITKDMLAEHDSGVMATALDQFVKMGIVLLTSAPFIGLMAWTVPNALCIDAMKEASGGEDVLDGFKECIFMHNADWDNSPILTTVWMLYWAVTLTFNMSYPVLVLVSMYGLKTLTRSEKIFQGSLALAVFSSYIGLILRGVPTDGYIFFQIQMWIGQAQFWASALVAGRVSGIGKLLSFQWFALWSLLGITTVIYTTIVPQVITSRATVPQLGLFRFAFHPLIWASLLYMCRYVLQRMRVREMSSVNLIMVPYFISALYGQFLLLQLESAGSVFIIRFMMAMITLTLRLTTRTHSAGALEKLHTRPAAEAMQATREEQELAVTETFSVQLAEVLAVVATGVVFFFANVTEVPGVKEPWTNTVLQCVSQLAVVVLETLGLLFIDKYFHKIPVGQVWRSMTGRTMAFLCVALSVGMLSEVTKLFLYFCPKYYDEHGVLLEYCNVHSVFESELLLNQCVTDASPGVVETFDAASGELLFSSSEL